MRLIEITDSIVTAEQSSYYCDCLEEAQIIWSRQDLLNIRKDDRRFLCDIRQTSSEKIKNISYDWSAGNLRGYGGSRVDSLRLSRILHQSAQSARQAVMKLLAPYAQHLQPDLVSFRPLEEELRALPLVSRNDLIHIDAFPSRPVRDRRILRFFTNLDFLRPRVWAASESFAVVAQRMAFDAGLADQTLRSSQPRQLLKRRITTMAAKLRRQSVIDRSPYDRFMLAFHDYLKKNQSFQTSCPKELLEFPAGSSWIAFTDAIPHAVVSGRCALEQTFFLPVAAMLAPARSPLRILERIAGTPLA